jgi:hypothetical protein
MLVSFAPIRATLFAKPEIFVGKNCVGTMRKWSRLVMSPIRGRSMPTSPRGAEVMLFSSVEPYLAATSSESFRSSSSVRSRFRCASSSDSAFSSAQAEASAMASERPGNSPEAEFLMDAEEEHRAP